MISKRLFLSHTITSLLWFTTSSLLTWLLMVCFLLALTPLFKKKKGGDAIVYRFVSSKYLAVSLVPFSLSWVVRRVTRNVLASVLVFGERERWAAVAGEGGLSFLLLRDRSPAP